MLTLSTGRRRTGIGGDTNGEGDGRLSEFSVSGRCETPEVIGRGGTAGMVSDKVDDGFRGFSILIGDEVKKNQCRLRERSLTV